MKLARMLLISGMALFLMSCGKKENELTVVNSKSFAEKQITLDGALAGRISTDSIIKIQEPTQLTKRLDELISRTEKLKDSESDGFWISLLKGWEEVKMEVSTSDSLVVLRKWAKLNSNLLKYSAEVRFGDELEKILYQKMLPVFSEKDLKSLVYTHVYDQIFINILATSSLTHYHTTGGIIKLVQQTNYPESNEMTLKCESNDVRYLDVFIRIPEWAVNPTVTHGNVKYVAHPGEYCQISRKWNDGDEINVRLKN